MSVANGVRVTFKYGYTTVYVSRKAESVMKSVLEIKIIILMLILILHKIYNSNLPLINYCVTFFKTAN